MGHGYRCNADSWRIALLFIRKQKHGKKAEEEIALASMYDYIVINDDVDNAADRIKAIIRAEHAKTRRTITEYMKMVDFILEDMKQEVQKG